MDSTIRIINNEFENLGTIDDYSSFYFVRNFTKAKEFQIVTPIKYLDILKDGNIIFTIPKKAGIIEDVEVNESKKTITVKGRDLKSIVGRRLTVPPVGKAYDEIKATAEEVIKHYVLTNCINPVDPKRKIPQLELAANKKRGSTIAWQSRFKYLDFEIERICNAAGIGWEVYLDLDKEKFIFDVALGVDRTKDLNSKVKFSEEFDNLTNSTYTNSASSFKTMGFVAGQGEGEERAVQEVFKTVDTGLNRRELFIDARDIENEDNLGDRAKAKLSEYDYITSNESTYINSNFEYEKDWNLGDIVILKNSLGESQQRVAEVTEVYEGYMKIDIVLGNVIPLVTEKMSNEINGSPSGDSSSKMWRPSVDSEGNLTWILNSSLDVPVAQNIKGPRGDRGLQGIQGEKGLTGERGLQGIQGVPGEKGDQGPRGLTGPQGPTGATGATGPKGTDGITPTIGTNGNWFLGATDTGKPSRGVQGPKGDMGPRGYTGSQGPQGIQGERGLTGPQGPPGKDGKDGTQIIVSSAQPSGHVPGRVWIQTL